MPLGSGIFALQMWMSRQHLRLAVGTGAFLLMSVLGSVAITYGSRWLDRRLPTRIADMGRG
jgi:hypothetical protein